MPRVIQVLLEQAAQEMGQLPLGHGAGDFSAPIIETDSITTHVYPNSGSFYATLLVNDEFGCFDDFSDSVR